MSNILLPRLLNPATMTETERLNPSGLSINLTQNPVSTADMTIEMQDAVIPMRSWIELFTRHGSCGIFRVSQSEMSYDSDEQRMTLEHGLCSLADAIMDGDEEEEKTPSQWLAAFVEKQTTKAGNTKLWRVGTVAATDTVYLTPGNSTLLDLLTQMMEQLPDYIVTTDQSSLPWKINIVAKSTTVQAEGRLSRNLTSARVSYDDSDLCTRVYAYNLPNGYRDANTVSTYGIVEQYMAIDEQTAEADAIRFANQYLKKRKEPSVSIELDAVDLAAATGESLDAFTIGKKFRLALPAYGVTIEEWITGIDYADVYGDPDHVTITLANEVADLSQRMAKTQATANSADSRSKGNSSSSHRNGSAIAAHDTRMETYDKRWEIIDDYKILRETSAGVVVGDALVNLYATVTDTYGNMYTKDDIVRTMRAAGIDVDGHKSLVEIYATEQIQRKNATDTNAAAIRVNSNEIDLRVTKNGVIAAINVSPESGVRIQASRINLDGYVTASQLSAAMADFQFLLGNTVTFNSLVVSSSLSVTGSYFTFGGRRLSLKDATFVDSVSASYETTQHLSLYDYSGYTSFTYVDGISKSTDTIHYLGY